MARERVRKKLTWGESTGGLGHGNNLFRKEEGREGTVKARGI